MKLRNKSLTKQVFGRDLGLCRCCGFKGHEVHHIVSLIDGGKDLPENMVTLCHYCHKLVPNKADDFIEYARLGGARLPFIMGLAILNAEKLNIPYSEWFPAIKEMINSLRTLEFENAIEKYSIKEALFVRDIEYTSK